jgi:hypothetical protein
LFRVCPIFWKGFPKYGVPLLADDNSALICALRRISFFTAAFHSSRVAGISTYLRMISRASHRGSPFRNFSIIPLSLADHPAQATSQSKVAIYVSTSHPFISSCINSVNASCVHVVSWYVVWKAVSNSVHSLLSVSAYWFGFVGLVFSSSWSNWCSAQSSTFGPVMKDIAKAVLWKGFLIVLVSLLRIR